MGKKMIQATSRIRGLIKTLEAGEDVTADQVRRALQLQALDVAVAGEDFAADFSSREDWATQQFKTVLEI